ncbi:MAG: hypothetical protein R3F11_26465 [Verrucomicrobiales bacterium]
MNEALAKLGPEALARSNKLDVLGLSMPESEFEPALKWDGEGVTLEVFRDLGLAFGACLNLIYVLMVGWFRLFVAAAHRLGILFVTQAFSPFRAAKIIINGRTDGEVVCRAHTSTPPSLQTRSGLWESYGGIHYQRAWNETKTDGGAADAL